MKYTKTSQTDQPNKNKKSRLGQTLIEVIVATGVVALVMTSIVSIVAISVRNTARAKAKILATKYTQEGIEYFRSQRKIMGWETFYSAAQQAGAASTFCLEDLPYTTSGGFQTLSRQCESDDTVDPNGVYQRVGRVTAGTNAIGQYVNIAVTVTWNDSGALLSSTASAELRPN